MPSIFLSIITPTYNSEKTIHDCLLSVVKQKFLHYEHIIVDNISTDKTLDIVKKFNSKHIRVFSQNDRGIYDAMNIGIMKSKGKFLLFLNSDDFILKKNFFSHCYKILKDSKINILYSNIVYKKNILNMKRFYRSGDFNKNYNKLGWHLPHPGSIIKKNFCLQQGMFSLKYKISSDFDFFIKAQNNKNVNFYYYNFYTVLMSLGGASSGLFNIIKSNIECYHSLVANGVKNPLRFIFLKLLRKFIQFF